MVCICYVWWWMVVDVVVNIVASGVIFKNDSEQQKGENGELTMVKNRHQGKLKLFTYLVVYYFWEKKNYDHMRGGYCCVPMYVSELRTKSREVLKHT